MWSTVPKPIAVVFIGLVYSIFRPFFQKWLELNQTSAKYIRRNGEKIAPVHSAEESPATADHQPRWLTRRCKHSSPSFFYQVPWERLESCKVVQDLSGSFFPRICWFKPLDGIYSGLILSSEVVKLVSVNSNPYFQFRRDDRLSCHGIKKTTLKLTTETLKTNSNSLKVVIFAFLATQQSVSFCCCGNGKQC